MVGREWGDLEWSEVRWGEWKQTHDEDGRMGRMRYGISQAFEKSEDGVNTVVRQRIYTQSEYREL